MKFRNSIEIKEPSDWELIGCDVLDEFLSDFPERKGLTRPPEYEDEIDFDGCVTYMYTQKGMELYYRMEKKLNKLGNKIFPDEVFSYNPSNMIMP